MLKINEPEYDTFRINVKVILENNEDISKNTLRKLMRDKGFRKKRYIEFDRELGREVKDYRNAEPTDKQVEVAWEYVLSKSNKVDYLDNIVYRTERYKHGSVRRLMRDKQEYNKKIYRKGQFLPKNFR